MASAVIGGTVASACGRGVPPEAPSFTFACPRGDTIRSRFTADSAFVLLPRDPVVHRLPHAISGSGARYSDGALTFWNKGDSAFVMRGDSIVIRDCGVVR